MDSHAFNNGDVVKVIDDMVLVHSLQSGHGGWNDDMALVSSTLCMHINLTNLMCVLLAIIASGARSVREGDKPQH